MASLLTNLGWKFAERIASQAVSFIVSIVLARILAPADYGAIAMVMIFVSLANVLVEGGFSSALIQKKNADRLDFSTVFYFSIFCSVLLYIVLYISAPIISNFYGAGYEILTPVLRVIGIEVIINAINSVQQAYVSRQMMFRKFFWSSLIGTIISAVIGLFCAYNGYGVWSLVWQQLSMVTINTLVLYLVTKKLPGLEFSLERLKGLFGYGVKILGASLLITAFLELRSLIIGKLYSAKDLAFFDRGKQMPLLLVTNINSSVGAVLFPKMSHDQNDLAKIKQTCRNSIRFSAYVMSPMMIGLMACSESLIRFLLTEKWIGCVPFLQVFCIIYLFYPLHTANLQAIKAIGKSGVFLKLELIKKTIEIICLLLVMKISMMAIVINMAILTTLFTIINGIPSRKYLNYSFREQFQDILPSIVLSSIMGGAVYLLKYLHLSDLLLLIIQVAVGCIIYLFLSFLFKNPELKFLLSLVLKRR